MRLLAILLFALCARAAVVEGVILDDETGYPLARTQVDLIPLPGTKADVTTVRTGARGAFVILSVRPGWYILRATRRGFSPTESGQLHPGRPGKAFQVADDRAAGFIEIHMSHLPAVTGTVFDENGIGIPHWTVHIYTSRKPVRHVSQVDTDDRGIYRIGELDPGSYLLRTGEGHLEDGTPILATYSHAAVELADAVGVSVHPGETLRNIDIRPVKGRLLTITGSFLAPPDPGWAALTMVTDTGRRKVAEGNLERPFTVSGIQPGPVEFLVKGNDGFEHDCGSYTLLAVDKDVEKLRLACNPIQPGSIQVTGGVPKGPLTVRRVDLDGISEVHALGRNEQLAPGRWELNVPRSDQYYVSSVRASGPSTSNAGWYGFDAGSYLRVVVTLSTRVSTISGVVSTAGSPVAGAPVFLSLITSGESWNVRADPQGNYSITGLGPGDYTIISGFDLELADGPTMRKPDTVYTSFGSTTVHSMELVLP